MDPIERLNSLSEDVIQTFHSDFVFLIDAEDPTFPCKELDT